MSFSAATITHSFENADGTPASGTITFALTDIMTNGTISIVPAEISKQLDASGNLSQSLTSNLDPAVWSLTGTATGGTFQLAIAGTDTGTVLTAALPYNATAAAVQAAIQALTGLSGVTCSGGPLGAAITINGLAGNLSVSISNNLLAGGTATVTQTATGTTPAAPGNAHWRVDLRILGASQQTFYFDVPAGGGSFDLFSLIPNTPQV